jgi:hypothetical protein
MITKLNAVEIKFICDRCGYSKMINPRQLYRDTDLEMCQSCKAEPARTVMKNGRSCTPHRGEVDLETMAPLDEFGNLYLPGHRICGMADCVARKHIIKPPRKKKIQALTYKPGMAILKGQVITYEQFLEIEKIRRANA